MHVISNSFYITKHGDYYCYGLKHLLVTEFFIFSKIFTPTVYAYYKYIYRACFITKYVIFMLWEFAHHDWSWMISNSDRDAFMQIIIIESRKDSEVLSP